ncbi:outer membrane protein transport protein [uncultured Paracoccus sp.]|uniref:OmpP1/FadL family transporter n=1 Tax=uncultured Paracoccus sp. TaxID=189685 RepID=UPI00262C213F|nr:outer membrane protein transport protein [uncultured Paracoccus sp.]
MKRSLSGAAALMLTAAPVLAGGIERAPQSLSILFEPGNYVEFSAGRVSPDVSGTDLPLDDPRTPFIDYPGGRSTGSVAKDYNFVGFGYKHQFSDQLSAALIVEQPFGADVRYPAFDPASMTDGSGSLGGTGATVDSTTYTGLVRYRMNNGFAVHGGLRGSRASGEVDLRGAAYGAVDGYSVELDDAWGVGYVLGASWERPEIAARVSLTYNSPVEHDFDTVETGPGIDPDGPGPVPPLPLLEGASETTVKTPRSWTLEGQTGIAPGTLLFGSIRWVNWSEFRVDPVRFTTVTGGGLVDLEDSTTYVIGVGRQFTDNWSGAVSFAYEKEGDDLVSPLAPSTGRKGVSLAAIYTRDKWKVTTGVSYTKLGDARPETGEPDVARAEMRDSDAFGAGVKVGYSF